MKKRDFIQTACIQFMPETQWDITRSIQYAEKLWLRLDGLGYGEPKPSGPQELKRAYDRLGKLQQTGFDLFWLAFDYKKSGKDEAAGAWLQMDGHSKADYDKIISAARQAATERKALPEGQVPMMAQGWLNKRRWLSYEATPTDHARLKQTARQQALFKLNQNISHAKRMAEQTGEQFWADETQKLTDQLRNLRDNPHD